MFRNHSHRERDVYMPPAPPRPNLTPEQEQLLQFNSNAQQLNVGAHPEMAAQAEQALNQMGYGSYVSQVRNHQAEQRENELRQDRGRQQILAFQEEYKKKQEQLRAFEAAKHEYTQLGMSPAEAARYALIKSGDQQGKTYEQEQAELKERQETFNAQQAADAEERRRLDAIDAKELSDAQHGFDLPLPPVPSRFRLENQPPSSSSSSGSSGSALAPSSASSSSTFASGSDPRIFGAPIHPAHPVGDKYADEERMLAEQAAPRANLLDRFRPEGHGSAAAAPIPQEAPAAPQAPFDFYGDNRPEGPSNFYGDVQAEGPSDFYGDRRQRDDNFYGAPGFASGGEVNAHGRFKMSPAEQAYIMQAQEQKNMTGDPGSPLQRGSIAAAQSVRGMPLSDKQHRRAIGKGLLNFSQGFVNPPQGKYDAFTHFAQSLTPAFGAYGAGMEQEELANEKLMKEQFEKEIAEKKMEDQAEYRQQKMGMDQIYKNMRLGLEQARLNESKSYHEKSLAKKGIKNTDAYEKRQQEKQIGLLNKQELELKKYKNQIIKDRMEEYKFSGKEQKAAARKSVEAEVNAEIYPMLKQVQDQLESYRKPVGAKALEQYNTDLDTQAKSIVDEESALEAELKALKGG